MLMPREKAGWIREFDYLRGFAILAIVTIHVMAYSNTITVPSLIPVVSDFLSHLADFGVPVFFFVSGFVLSLRYFDVQGMRTFYHRRLSSILIPYIAFSSLYIVYNLYTIPGYTVERALWSLLLFDATGIFWFIAVLLQFYFLFPLLTRWQHSSERRGRSWEMLAVSIALYIIWYLFLVTPLAQGLDTLAQPVAGFGGLVAARLFPGYLAFFVLGIWAQRTPATWDAWIARTGSLTVIPLILLLVVALQFLRLGPIWALLVLPFTILMLGPLYRASRWLMRRQGALARSTRAIGTYSYGIYLAHMLAIAVVVNRLWALGIFADQAIFYLILLPGTIMLSMAALFLLNLLPFGERLSGVRVKARPSRGGASTEPREERV